MGTKPRECGIDGGVCHGYPAVFPFSLAAVSDRGGGGARALHAVAWGGWSAERGVGGVLSVDLATLLVPLHVPIGYTFAAALRSALEGTLKSKVHPVRRDRIDWEGSRRE